MKWICASDIKNWAETKQRHCQDTLPELVRRLVLAHTANAVEDFDFPSGDSVAASGWDGRLKTSVISPFFPNGLSGWEIGSQKTAQKKADDDYKKRTADSLGMAQKDTVFIFVTPRPFSKRIKWQSEKSAIGVWKDVSVIAADKLEQWLDVTPAVALWLARQIGKVVSGGIRDIENFWEEWSVGTNPQMTTELVIGGRTTDMESIHGWLSGQPRLYEIQGDDPDESIAFLYSSIASLPKTEQTQALSRCIVVENINEFREVTQAFQNYPLIIVAHSDCIQAANLAVSKGHHVFISVDDTVVGIRKIARLARPRIDLIEKILHEKGLSEKDAERLARDTGHSISVLRRHLSQSNAVSAPSWVTAQFSRLLIPALLINRWDDNVAGDRGIAETLSGMKYDDFVKNLTPLLSIDDSPIRKVDNVWSIKSSIDAWFLLAQFLDQDQLNLFGNVVTTVLSQIHPKYGLEPEKRWAAAIYGKASPYSGLIRYGLAESLALIAVNGERCPQISSLQFFINKLVKELFDKADRWEVWASLKDVTPLLAEAAPEIFLDSIDAWIVKKPSIFPDLMKDDQSGIMGECNHSGLLWGLEAVAWQSEYMGRVVNIFILLAGLDSGGRWSNRPINSLGDIFFPVLPQTHATPKERLAVLEKIILSNPKIVWGFSQRYFGNGYISESGRFRWRATGGNRRGLEKETNEENIEYLNGLMPMLRDLGCAKENIISSLDEFTRIPEDTREKLLTTVNAIDPKMFSKEDQELLRQKTREALNWINGYGDEGMRKFAPALYSVLEKFSSSDVFERVGWLLNNPWPTLPQGDSKDYESKNSAVNKAQEEAARELLNNATIDRIVNFARTIQYQRVMGNALAKVVRTETEDNSIIDASVGTINELSEFIRGYGLGRVAVVGQDWVKKTIERLERTGINNPDVFALLYLCLPEGMTTWQLVKANDKDIESSYWKRASGYLGTDNNEEAIFAVESLLNVKRADAALQIAGDDRFSIPSSTIKLLLQEILLIDKNDARLGALSIHYFAHLFNQLYERNELDVKEIAMIEWPFAPLFDQLIPHLKSSTAVHRVLEDDPEFFSQLITFIYKRDDHAPDSRKSNISEEGAIRRAEATRDILSSWKKLPGIKPDGSLDEKILTDWVIKARKSCSDLGYIIGCDIEIGFMLAHAPMGNDGAWPDIPVRNLIESLNSKIISEHIETGIYNSRGVVSRDPSIGGQKERDIVAKYIKMSDIVKVKWPRTATMLRAIADSYEKKAKHEDVFSNLHDLRLN